MPDDPRECRKRAARCAELAVRAKNEPLRAQFAALSTTWEKLANELDRTEAIMWAIHSDNEADAA